MTSSSSTLTFYKFKKIIWYSFSLIIRTRLYREWRIFTSSMNSSPKKSSSDNEQQQKIAALEKQLQWEKLRADALDTMINVAEKQLDITIRKKPGTQQPEK